MRTFRRSLDRVDALVALLGPGPWTLAEVRAAGWSTAHIRRAVDRGWLVRPRRGALDVAGGSGPAAGVDPAELLRRRAEVLLDRYAGGVVSHASAAVLHGLWLPHAPDSEVHLISPRRPDREEAGVRVHGSRLPRDHIVDLWGLPVTSVARTAIDVARGRSIEDAVLVLDSAARVLVARAGIDLRRLRDAPELRAEWSATARHELWSAYRSVRRWPFTVVVRTAIPLLDPASESPLESRSRIRIASSGLPEPEIAVPVLGASGREYVVDFLWREYRVIGEADGAGKYGEDAGTVRARLRAERRRQRDLEDAGWTFARWESTEPGRVMLQRVRRTLTDGGWNPVSLG
ncbi:MAG: type IV toxin-antitoxin system AbiEi family antitoxin domain-containing protein [Candidatus Nanopelagicales bacterium]